MSVTKEQGDLFGMLTHQIHDNWVAYSGYGAAEVFIDFAEELNQAHGNQSDVFDSLKLWYVTLTFEIKIHRSG